VVVADERQIAAAGKCIIEMHGLAAREKENVLHALLGNKAHDIVSESHAPLANRFYLRLGGPKQHVHDLAHGSVAASEFGDHPAMLSDRRARISRTGAETNDAKRGQIVHIVSNEANLLQA
jgi:hypothetical protein